jgi:hypothetical protein
MSFSNEIIQYRPAYYDGFKNEAATFETKEQLFEIPWIKRFRERQGFHQFSVSGDALMAEYACGKEWWVCGFLKHPVFTLPVWTTPWTNPNVRPDTKNYDEIQRTFE